MNASSSKLFITTETELSDIILNYPRTILLLSHFNIYTPLKSKSIEKICSEYDISPSLFIGFIDLYINENYTYPTELNISDLLVIVDFLKRSHIYYINDIYPEIHKSIKRIKELNNYDEIKMIDKFFDDYFAEVKTHLDYEDDIVFPYIHNIYDNYINKTNKPLKSNYSVTEYKEHHDDIEEKLDDLMNLLIRYLPYKNDQQARRVLFWQLVEVNHDLKIHAKIEDLILIPLVEKLELQLNSI